MSRLLPLFPLQLVVFPGSPVPLHIFEERYKAMVGEAESQGTEFGIVLAKDEGIVNIGCTVSVETVLRRYPDGRFDVMTRGRRRFTITSLDQEKAWLQGEVEYFEDDDSAPVSEELRNRALKSFERMKEATGQSGDESPDVSHPFLSFQLAESIDDLGFKAALQRIRSESERLRHFVEFLESYIPTRQYAAKMKRAAPMNGSGHKPASL
jgi:Lon protease-like protein